MSQDPSSTSLYEKDILKSSLDTQSRNEATIVELLDIPKQLDKHLDRFLFSSEWVEEETTQMVDEKNPVTGVIEKIPKPIKKGWYKHFPTDEKIIGCRRFGIQCTDQNFIPDTNTHYAVDSDIFEGFCIVFNLHDKPAEVEARLNRLKEHIATVHQLDADLEDLVYNAQDLTWDPMFGSNGFEGVKSYIKMHVAPITSTSIIPETKNKLAVDVDQILTDQSTNDALANVQDIILNHRQYGFKNNPTHIIELERLEQKLFKLALQRSINGITIRGIITQMEEKRVDIRSEVPQKSGGQGGDTAFNRIIQR